jgi:tyrosine-protein kinase Etk/Wzc
MNSLHTSTQPLQTLPAPAQGDSQDDDAIDLLSLLDVMLDARWLIAAVTVLTLLLGGAYA